jgi:hypothetical protein
MKPGTHALAAAVLVSALAVLGTQAREPHGWSAPVEIRPTLIVHATATGHERAPAKSMSASMELVADSYRSFVFMPGFATSDDLCPTSLRVSLNPADLEQAAAAWFIEARLVDMRDGEATVDLRWKRAVNRPDILPAGSFESGQRLVLREGEPGILDLVRVTGTEVRGCSSFGLTYELRLAGAARLADTAIEYDLWLVHTDARGRQVTERYRTSGRQGEEAEYFFRPIGFARDGERNAGQPALDLRVSGAVRGRLRTDGRIDLTVGGESFVFNTERSGSVSTQGRTLLTVDEGETVEVELPAVGGQVNGIDLGRIFEGQRTAVRITAHRLW